MPGAKPAPIASRANEKSTRAKSLQVKPASGIPCAMVLRFPSCSLVSRAFLPPSQAATRLSIAADLTPASGCQDHTTSPSASPRVRRAQGKSVHRIPRPTLVTIAKRLSCRERGTARKMRLILAAREAIYFLRGGWTKRANQSARERQLPPSFRDAPRNDEVTPPPFSGRDRVSSDLRLNNARGRILRHAGSGRCSGPCRNVSAA
jgi:hypothetical protein